MERWLSFKQSKTLDKSLSYLSGVGEDLSFDIAYFMRLSECTTRYINDALFLGYNKKLSIEDKIEFGELKTKYANEKSYLKSLELHRSRPFDVIDTFEFIDRERLMKFAVVEHFDFLYTNRSVRLSNKLLYAKDNIQSSIFELPLEEVYRIAKQIYGLKNAEAEHDSKGEIPKPSHPDFSYLPKPGGDIYHTEQQLSGKEFESLTTQKDVLTEGSPCMELLETRSEFVPSDGKVVDIDKPIEVATRTITIDMNEFMELEVEQPHIALKRKDYLAESKDKLLAKNIENLYLGYTDKHTVINNVLNIGLPTKIMEMLSNNEQVHNSQPNILINDNLHTGTRDKGVDADTGNMIVNKDKNGINNLFESIMMNIESKATPYVNSHIMVNLITKGLYDDGSSINQVSSHSKSLNNVDENIIVGNHGKGVDMAYVKNSFLQQNERLLSENKADDYFIYKETQTLFEQDLNSFIDKANKQLSGSDTFEYLSKENKGTGYSELSFVDKSNKPLWMVHFDLLDKNIERPVWYTDGELISKEKMALSDGALNPLFASKTEKGIVVHEAINLTRTLDKGILTNNTELLSKFIRSTFLEHCYDTVFRDIPYVLDTYEIDEFCHKTLRPLGGVDDSFFISKSNYRFNVEENSFGVDKNPYYAAIENTYVTADKNYLDTSVPGAYEAISKYYRPTNIEKHKLPFVNKNYKPTDLKKAFESAFKEYIKTDETQTHLFYTVPKREFRINKEVLLAYKNYRNTHLNNTLTRFKPAYRDTHIRNNLVQFSKRQIFNVMKQGFAYRPSNPGIVTDSFITLEDTGPNEVNMDTLLFVEDKARDTMLNRGDDFAYVDKPDYTKIKDDRIDELQLPSSDFNYSNFSKKLFINGSLDIRYVKRIDEDGNIFITLPIENPIKHFSDLATEYIDLNVGMLIYIIEKAYNIWQNNIFVYSAMPSDSALNDILKKLKQNLFIQYPSEEDQYHLHRAIRLFRWYAEMSILNNAEYMVKLKYKDIAVDYAHKDLSYFDGIALFNNMSIDNSYVLTPTDKSQPCGITFNINRGHKVRLKFDAAITGGTCVINVNGTSDTYIEQMLNFDVELPEGENTITVSFEPTETTNYFGVMKLTIEKYTITSYDVIYVGKIGESNPTINQLITMLSVCGDSLEDMQKTVAHATPTANALDQLRVYFNLHHEEKLKGKRLTIKK